MQVNIIWSMDAVSQILEINKELNKILLQIGIIYRDNFWPSYQKINPERDLVTQLLIYLKHFLNRNIISILFSTILAKN